jgi:hypothetical protein
MADSKNDKLISTGDFRSKISGGSANSSGNSGPTGSARLYPKGKGSQEPSPASFNPHNVKASRFGVEGV